MDGTMEESRVFVDVTGSIGSDVDLRLGTAGVK